MQFLAASMLLSRCSAVSAAAAISLLSLSTLPAAVAAPSLTTRFTQDFEDASVSSVESIGSPAWARSNVTTNVISGTRSQRVNVTALTGGSVAVTWLFTSQMPAAAINRKFRVSIDLKANTGTVQVRVNMRKAGADYGSARAKVLTITTTTQTVSFDFVWPFDDIGQLRVEYQSVGDLLMDNVILEEDTAWTGMAYSAGPVSPYLMGFTMNQAHVGGHLNAPNVNAAVSRIWGAGSWANVQPTDGSTFNWNYLDANLSRMAATGGVVMITLGRTPNWATANAATPTNDTTPPAAFGPGSNLLAVNSSDEIAFVIGSIRRAAGRIKFIELGNEVDQTPFCAATPGQMAARSQVLYAAIKAEDPSIIVLAPNVTDNGNAWLDEYFRAGGGAYCDALSYHEYLATDFKAQIAHAFNVRAIAASWGYSLPIYNTEGAPVDNTPGLIARTLATMAALGVVNFDYYTIEGSYGSGTALAASPTYGANTALGDEFNRVATWLSGCSIVDAHGAGRVFYIRLSKPGGGTRIVAWTDGASLNVGGLASWGVTTSMTLLGATAALTTGYIDSASGAAQAGPVMALSASPLMLE